MTAALTTIHVLNSSRYSRVFIAMSSITLTAELLRGSRRSSYKLTSGYEINFLREATKRWLVLGVLCTVLLAVMTPKIGAPGGFLCTEYIVYLPITYIYYSSGRSCVSFSHVSRRACLIGITHTHIVAPALAVSLSQAIVERDSTNRGLLTGIILSSIGSPCGWLSLSVSTGASERARAIAILVCNYVTSLVAEPFYIFILCGRFTLPPVFPTLFSITTSTIAFCLGTYHHLPSAKHTLSSINHMTSSANHPMPSTRKLENHIISSANDMMSSTNNPRDLINMITSTGHKVSPANHMISPAYKLSSANHMISSDNHNTSSANQKFSSVNHKMPSVNGKVSSAHDSMSSSMKAQCCALAALYVECCTRLREAEGELYVTHVFATLILVLGWLCLNALFCCVYYRSGALSYEETYTVALCSVPKCLDVGWEFGTLCVPTGLSLLPAAFLAPSQALLLAAASRPDDEDDE